MGRLPGGVMTSPTQAKLPASTSGPQIYDVASVAYSARRSDETAEAVWQDRMAFRRGNIRQAMARLDEADLLDGDWSVDEATDFAWVLASVHRYEYLVVERGWTVEQLVARLKQVVRASLVAPEIAREKSKATKKRADPLTGDRPS